MKKIAVFTSGGDAPGMNAAIRAVVRYGLNMKVEIIGITHGYDGMIKGTLMPLDAGSVSNIIQRGGTILKTARSAEFMTGAGMRKAYENLKRHRIDGVIAIGGDGTFRGAVEFCKKFDVPFVGIPGTIDNDLFGTDFTLGYDTAVNTIIEAVDKIKDTAASHDRLFFIEVMGRDSGYIALWSGIAGGAEEILLPETKTDIDSLVLMLRKRKKSGKSSIVIVAEGDEAGGALEISEMVRKKIPSYDIRVTILGHTQRGGNPTAFDRILGTRLGVASVEALMEGVSGVMAGWINNKVHYTPFEKTVKGQSLIDQDLIRIASMLS